MKLPKHEYQLPVRRKQGISSCLGEGIIFLLVLVLFGMGIAGALSLGRQVRTLRQDGSRVPRPGEPGCEVSDRFPEQVLQWCDLITGYAQVNQLEPDLIAAMVWYESGGNQSAYSKDGAVGLMQVMPRDGKAANFDCPDGPCFRNRPTINQLRDPEYNLRYGTWFLSQLLASHAGDLREALKDYGPIGVDYAYADTVLQLYYTYGKVKAVSQP